MYTKIKAKKDLYNLGKCFTKGRTYELKNPIESVAALMEVTVTNDLGQRHTIGSWWRNFSLV